MKDQLNKGATEIFTNSKVKEVLKEFVNNKITLYMEVISENHLVIFYPIPFFRVEPINSVFLQEVDNTKYQDVSFHWIPLS